MAYSRRGQPPQTYANPSYATQTRPTTQCTFTWDIPRSAYSVKCEYQPNFIEFIKAKVPASDRVWDPNVKMWYIKEAWYEVLHELAGQLWPGAVASTSKSVAEAAWQAQENARRAAIAAQRAAILTTLDNAILDFCTLCDSEALRACYRKMSLALHPDRGGDADKMSKLNASWYVLETELKKKELP